MIKKSTLLRALPVLAGVLFCLYYVRLATDNVAFTDYIRLINSYLPDVDNPAKFFVPDILTRAPLTYLARLINVKLFGYDTRFDIVLGILSLGLGGLALAAWSAERDLRWFPYLVVMVLYFGLNKWEMLGNGTGWVCFLSVSGFIWHFAVLERAVRTRCASPRDRMLLYGLPPLLTFTVTATYCGAYIAILTGMYLLLIAEEVWVMPREVAGKENPSRPAPDRLVLGTWIRGLASALGTLAVYLLSRSFAVYEYTGVYEGSLPEQFRENPVYFVRFTIKAFASDWLDGERLHAFAEAHAGGEALVLLTGVGMIGLYLLTVFLHLRFRLYRENALAFALVLYAGLSHLLIVLARGKFMNDEYGMSSRYALQYQTGVIGIFLTFALLAEAGRTLRGRQLLRILTTAMAVLFLVGSLKATKEELHMAPYRREFLQVAREYALNYRTSTDAELKEYLQKDAANVRKAMAILEENHLNIFR